MIITRKIHEISGVLQLDQAPPSKQKIYVKELKAPSLSLQAIAFVGLASGYALAPPLTDDILLGISACLFGILVGIFASFSSHSITALNIGALTTVVFSCVGFRLLLVAAERTASWTLPIGALFTVSIAVIVSGPAIYAALVAVILFVLDVNFGASSAPQDDGWWPQLLLMTATSIGLISNVILWRLRRLNALCTVRLVEMAYKDHLTEIPNRRWFIEAVELALKNGHLNGYLFILDLDDFKRINDEAGHHIGDVVLKEVGAIIKTVATGLPYGRLGGEEFVVVVPGQRSQAENVAERLLQAVRGKPIADRHVSVSIGASHLEGDSIRMSLRRADEALYWAKASGKDRVSFYPD